MPENSLRVVARITALPDQVESVRSILLELIAPTRSEEGCISYELLQNKADATDFTFVEEWRDDSTLNSHLVTRHVQNAIAQVQGLLTESPDIRRYSVLK